MNLNTQAYLNGLRKPNNPRAPSPQVTQFSGINGWRCVLLHELSDAENEGGHAVYVDCLNPQGQRILPTANSIRYGWEGMTLEEMPPLSPFEKQSLEPGGNVPIFPGQNLWIEIWDVAGASSDRISGLCSLPTGHKSFYAVFQFGDGEAQPNGGRMVQVSYDTLLDMELSAKRLHASIQALRGGK